MVNRSPGVQLLVALCLGLFVTASAGAQSRYSRGQGVWPAFEGWWQNENGTYTLFFGYMNDNWEQVLDVPVGSLNNIEPGGPDQGQPTHFLPRRNLFRFEIVVPADFGDKELVWTLTANGQTNRTYASLRTDYLVDKQTIATEVGANRGGVSKDWQWNEPPTVRLDVDAPRRVKVGEPLTLTAWASDEDGIPSSTRAGVTLRPQGKRSTSRDRHAAYTPPRQIVPGTSNGLRFSWYVYRGEGEVAFEPVQMKTWQDTRPYANSPWSPPFELPAVPDDGKWEVTATFDEPGTYVLRALAGDGALFSWQDAVITVDP